MDKGQNAGFGGDGSAVGGFDAFGTQGGISNSPIPMQNNLTMMGQGVPMGQPMAPSGTGDIVLNADGEGKSRKGLVITLIVLVVLAIGAGVGYALWQGGVFGGGGSETVQNKKEELRIAFNKFANYLYRGEASEGEFELDWNGTSANELRFMLEDYDGENDENTRREFLNKAKTLGDEFYAKLDLVLSNDFEDGDSTEYALKKLQESIKTDFDDIYTLGMQNEEVDDSDSLSAELMVALSNFSNRLRNIE